MNGAGRRAQALRRGGSWFAVLAVSAGLAGCGRSAEQPAILATGVPASTVSPRPASPPASASPAPTPSATPAATPASPTAPPLTPVAPATPPVTRRANPSPTGDLEEQPGVLSPVTPAARPTAPPAIDFASLAARPGLPATPLAVPAPRPEAEWSNAERALRRAVAYYAGIATRTECPGLGSCLGWNGRYTADLARRTGEAGQDLPPDVVLIQRNHANIGTALLSAYRATGAPEILEAARGAGNLLLAGQTPYGGWNAEMWIGQGLARGIHVYPGQTSWPDVQEVRGSDYATVDDSSTNAEAEFLYRLWWATKEPRWYEGWRRTMDFLLLAQRESGNGGGFPQGFPGGGYHRYATFNDHAMRNCVESLLRAWRRTGDRAYYDSVVACGDWIARIKRPGFGWGVQYDVDQIAGARSFEPPGLGPGDGTVDAMEILKLVYDLTGDPRYVAPILDAAGWLERAQLEPGRWARFYHPDTGAPWYRNLQGDDVATADQAKGGYTWVGSWGNAGLKLARELAGAGPKDPQPAPPPEGEPGFAAEWLAEEREAPEVGRILESQAENGSWPAPRGRRPRKGKGQAELWLEMSVFVQNLNALARAVAAERR